MTDDRALLPFDEGDGRLIRRQWHDGRWFFSVVDVVRLLTDSERPRLRCVSGLGLSRTLRR